MNLNPRKAIDRLRNKFLRKSHLRAIRYYEALSKTNRKSLARASCERAHHLIEIDEPARALDTLSDDERAIVSFGNGGELLRLLERLEKRLVVNPECGDLDEARMARDMGFLYTRVSVGDIEDHYLKAIRFCNKSLNWFAENENPFERALSLNVLGMACSSLPIGDPG